MSTSVVWNRQIFSFWKILAISALLPILRKLAYPEPLRTCDLVFGEGPRMSRTLIILFRRDPSKDRSGQEIHYEGYQPFWPDGRPVAVGLDAFCQHGQRLLSLGRHLAGRHERLIRMTCFPLGGREDSLTRLPGYRVRRFFIERQGPVGRIHFLDGTPTTAVFEIGRDEPRVLHWIGLSGLDDGDRQWFDLAATPIETIPIPRSRTWASEIYNLS